MKPKDLIEKFKINFNGLKILENELGFFKNNNFKRKVYTLEMIYEIEKLIKDKYMLPNNAIRIKNSYDYITPEGDIFKERGNTGLYFKAKSGLVSGYIYCGINYVDKGQISKRVHRIVAETFLDNPENKPYVNHIDGDKTNNHVNNLQWVTNSENVKHAYENKLIKNYKGKYNKLSKSVDMYDLQNNIVNSFESISQASNIMNIPKRTISNQCDRLTKTRKYSYYFRYKV